MVHQIKHIQLTKAISFNNAYNVQMNSLRMKTFSSFVVHQVAKVYQLVCREKCVDNMNCINDFLGQIICAVYIIIGE